MRSFWLMDQHEGSGPTALVETDNSLKIVDVVRFGPTITELDGQQKIWDKVIGRVAPTLKPCVKSSTVDEEGVAPLPELRRESHAGANSTNRATRRAGGDNGGGSTGQLSGGPSRSQSRGGDR